MLTGYHKPEHGSLRDNEMSVNGKAISAGMSDLPVSQHKDVKINSPGQIILLQ